MSDKNKEEKEIPKEELNINATTESIKLIGNKRERELTEEDKISIKTCTSCKSANSYFKDGEDSKTIIEIFSKESELMNILKQNIETATSNNNLELNSFCQKCILNEFIKGGIEKIFSQKKSQETDKKEKKEKNELDSTQKVFDKKVGELISVYSLNLMMTINNLKKMKEEYSQMVKAAKEIFDGSCIQIMFSKNKDLFQDIKKKIDDCKSNFYKIEENFDNLINNLKQKEEMKTFLIMNDNSNQKSKLLKLLKNLENEIENDLVETTENNADKNIKEQKTSKEQNEKNIANLFKQSNDLLKNNLLLSQSYLNNGPNLFNNGLNILPFSMTSSNTSNNPLLNNLMLNSQLNPSILNQINNTINLNSMLSNMNSNSNETTKNINNINNLSYPGINNLSGQNFAANTLSNLEYILYLNNLLNNSNSSQQNNNLMNNLYSNQLNPNLMPSISLNNFLSPNSQIVPKNINNNNINATSLNNNNLNRDKNMPNINPNLNNYANINNLNNLKDLNNINNPNESLNNNLNKIQMNQNLQNPNNNPMLILQLFNQVADEKKNEKNNIYSNNNSQK